MQTRSAAAGRRRRARPTVERLETLLLLSAVPNDFDGDGRPDIVQFDKSTGTFEFAYASSPNVIRSGVALKSSSVAGKSSTACAVSWRTVFQESSTVSVLTIDFHCNHGSAMMPRKEC